MSRKRANKPVRAGTSKGRVIDIDNMSEAERLEVEQLLRAERLKTKPSEKWDDIKDTCILRPKGQPTKINSFVKSADKPVDEAALAEARRHCPTQDYNKLIGPAKVEADKAELSYRAKQKARNEMLRRNMGKFGDCIFIPSEHR